MLRLDAATRQTEQTAAELFLYRLREWRPDAYNADETLDTRWRGDCAHCGEHRSLVIDELSLERVSVRCRMRCTEAEIVAALDAAPSAELAPWIEAAHDWQQMTITALELARYWADRYANKLGEAA